VPLAAELDTVHAGQRHPGIVPRRDGPGNRDKPRAATRIIHSGAVSARNPVSRTGEQNESSLLVLPSALVTMGEEPPEPRSPAACAFWWSLVPGPGEPGEYGISGSDVPSGRYRLAER
jgi:hypothetical protein